MIKYLCQMLLYKIMSLKETYMFKCIKYLHSIYIKKRYTLSVISTVSAMPVIIYTLNGISMPIYLML